MKQVFFILFTFFFVQLNIIGQGYTVSGEVENAENETVTFMLYRPGLPREAQQETTTKVNGGKFSFTGNLPYTELGLLWVGNKGPVNFFVDNSNIKILFDFKDFAKTTVTGSLENDLYKKFISDLEKLNSDSERTAYMINHIHRNPGKISTAYIAAQIFSIMNDSQLNELVKSFEPKTGESIWVKTIKEQLALSQKTAIGQQFLDITLKTPEDEPVSISDYAGKGKYVLLDFWASWCVPCRRDNPNVVALYNRYKAKGFEIVGISLDNSKEAWIKGINDDKITWPQMSDIAGWNSAAAKLYGVREIPYTFLLDKDGKIIAKKLSSDALKAKLAEIFD